MKKTLLPKTHSDLPKIDKVKEKIEIMNRTIGLNNIQLDKNPVLVISKEVDLYIRHLHKTYPNKEWLGICKVIQKPDTKDFYLIDMIHPEQTAHGTECEATDEGMEKLTQWIQENDPESLHQRPLTLHSHHSMGVFWSSTDDQARLKQNDGRPYSMAVVTAYDKNNPEVIQYKGCINFFKPYNIEFDFDIIVGDINNVQNSINEYEKQKESFYKEARENIVSKNNDNASFNLITSMLGEEVLDQLQKNSVEVSDKIFEFDIDKEYTKLLLQSEKPSEVRDLEEWIENRAEMLKNSFKKKDHGFNYYDPSMFPSQLTQDDFSDFIYYTEERFPKVSMLEEEFGMKFTNKPFLFKGVWYVFYKGNKIFLDEYSDIIFSL